MADKTTPPGTMSAKPDDDVGKPGSAPAGGGRQTPEQAAITGTEAGGRSDADRSRETRRASGQAGRNPVPIGGSSAGHSDRKSATGEGGRIAQGHDKVEKER